MSVARSSVEVRAAIKGEAGVRALSATGRVSGVDGFGTNIVFRTSRLPLVVPSFRCGGSACYDLSEESNKPT